MRDRVTQWFAAMAPASVWRGVMAVLACLVTVVAMSRGLVYWLPWLQVGVVAGLVVGLIAPSVVSAVGLAAATTGLGLAVAPMAALAVIPPVARVAPGLGAVLVAGALAGGVRWSASRQPGIPKYLVYLAIAIILCNLWGTSLTLNARSLYDPVTGGELPPLNSQLDGDIPAAFAGSDHALFMNVSLAVRRGEPYYPSFREHFTAWSGTAPSSVTNIRFPLISYMWAAVPRPEWIPLAFLVVASCGILASTWLGSTLVRAPLVIPGAAVLSAYYLYFATQIQVLTAEAWAVSFALLALAAITVSMHARRWLALTVAAVGFAVIAVLLRETLVFVPLAGMLSSLAIADDERRRRSLAWLAGVAVLAIAYGAHYLAARSAIDPGSSYQQFTWGGVSQITQALTFATYYLGSGGWLALPLGVLGAVGASAIVSRRHRLFAAVAVGGPLLAFMFVSNTAQDVATGSIINYWGAGVTPLLYAFVPVAFAFLPGAARGPRVSRGT